MSRTNNGDSNLPMPILVGGFILALLALAALPAFLSYLGVQPESGKPVVVEQQEDFDPFGIGLDNPLAPTLYPDLYPGW